MSKSITRYDSGVNDCLEFVYKGNVVAVGAFEDHVKLNFFRGAIQEICSQPPFRQMGDVRSVVRRFGGDPTRLRQTVADLQRRLYAA